MASNRQRTVRTVIPAGYARAAYLPRGSRIKVINTPGTQVVNCWAFNVSNS
ncbi:MAG: hypothetical protein CL401_02595 [Acidiferrobacteraceae bacterium]|nr:hypothetical protein [Acidiferrobacteraceae bacterium]